MILILDDQHQWSFQKEKPLVFLIQHPFIIVSTQRWENLTNIFLCLEPNHITILEGSVQYCFEIPMHICIRKLNFLTAVNFSFAYCNSSSEGLASEGWRLNLIDTGLFVFCFVFFFQCRLFSLCMFRKYPLLETIACKHHYSGLLVPSSGWLIRGILSMFSSS